jgi:hypothetical protein
MNVDKFNNRLNKKSVFSFANKLKLSKYSASSFANKLNRLYERRSINKLKPKSSQTAKLNTKLHKQPRLKPSFNTRLLNTLALALALMGVVSLAGLNLTSAAEPPTVDTRINVEYDGTAVFDGSNYSPGPDNQYGSSSSDPLAADNTDHGNDDGANNGIVRNGDDIGYRIQVNLNGADATNITATVTLSSGQFWQQLPGSCKPTGSSISSDKLTLTCNLGDLRQGTNTSFVAPAKISGSSPNNTLVNASASTTADGANTATATSKDTITTAAPRVNLVKKVLNSGNPFTTIDPTTNKEGKVIRYGLGLYAQKGSEQLNGATINITDTLTYPTSPVTPTHKLYTWGSENPCGPNPERTAELPYGQPGIVSGADASNSVTNSGTINCTQTSGAGTDIALSLSGADYSGDSIPYKFPDGSTISQDNNYLVAGYVDIWVPLEDFHDPANEFNGNYQLEVLNAYSTIDPTSVSGLSNYGAGQEDLSDNDVTVALTDTSPGGPTMDISFDGTYGNASKTGSVKSYAGANVYPFLQLATANLGEDVDTFACAKIDNSELSLTGNFFKAGTQEWFNRLRILNDLSPYAGAWTLGPDGIPNTADDGLTYDYAMSKFSSEGLGSNFTYLESDNFGNFYFKDPALLNPDLVFSSKPVSDYQTDTCDDADGPWITDPTTDPANFPNGWSSVTRIRFGGNTHSFSTSELNNNQHNFFIYPEMQIKPNLNPAAGGGYGNPAEPDAFVGLYMSYKLDADGNWQHGPIPTGVNNPYDSRFTDRVELVAAQLRVDKSITNLGGNTEVKAGDVVAYKLKTTLGGRPGSTTDILVDDELPQYLNYLPGSTVVTPGTPGILVNGQDPTVVSNIEPNIVSGKLQWELTNVEPGDELPTIDYQSQVDIDMTAGMLANIVRVSETSAIPLDTTSTDADKVDAANVRLSSTGDYDIIKLLTTPEDALIERNQPMSFDLTYANVSAERDINNLQFIEVFPYNNDGPRDPSSNYQGDLQFVSITGTLGGETYLYTDANPSTISLDPCNYKNVKPGDPVPAACAEGVVQDNGQPGATATGETNWYDCSGGFETGPCPIAQSAVTGIKINIDGAPALATGSTRQRFTLTLQPTGNQKDDLYTNNFGSRVDSNNLVTISNDVTVRVVASSIGDRLWLDLNGNGVQDSNEPGIPGVTVNLYDDQDQLIATATTDTNGNYLFPDLNAGDYRVEVDPNTLPEGISPTFDLDGIDSANNITGNLGQNTDIRTWDFGYRGTGSIGDTVWLDENENGEQDSGEAGMPNVPVEVTYYGPDGILGTDDDIAINLTTDQDGHYNLTGLPFGNYQVKVSPDSSYKNTYDLDGNKDSITTLTIDANNPENLTGDFGYVKKNTLEQIITNVSNATNLADTGENTKKLIAIAAVLIVVGVGVVILRRRG